MYAGDRNSQRPYGEGEVRFGFSLSAFLYPCSTMTIYLSGETAAVVAYFSSFLHKAKFGSHWLPCYANLRLRRFPHKNTCVTFPSDWLDKIVTIKLPHGLKANRSPHPSSPFLIPQKDLLCENGGTRTGDWEEQSAFVRTHVYPSSWAVFSSRAPPTN